MSHRCCLDLDIERYVLTVRAERRDPTQPNVELIASERPRGVFSRQPILGDTLDAGKVKAHYADGVLTLRIPVLEQAKPRKIEISHTQGKMQEIGTLLRGGRTPSSRPSAGDQRTPAAAGAVWSLPGPFRGR